LSKLFGEDHITCRFSFIDPIPKLTVPAQPQLNKFCMLIIYPTTEEKKIITK